MFRRQKPVAPVEWMVVGLGNPGGEFLGTRHNLGYEVVECLARRHRIRLDQSKHHARFGSGEISGASVLLVKPLTYMNESGRSVAPLARELGLSSSKIVVVSDDVDLPVGVVKLRQKGGSGGHNGHKSLIAALGTNEYPRIKLGIDSVSPTVMIDHVLGRFESNELDAVRDAIKMAADRVEEIVRSNLGLSDNDV